ncbi:MAG: LysR family transcriptional regulator [Bryobacterales bacterium]|nr:LysR family transcriptional regulator [Bryobacterales bacterium]
MDLRQLEMLRAVAENSSFTLAGRELHVAQSAISRKVKLLEDELGEKLFQRVNKRVFLTPAGKVILRYATRIFQEIRNASLEISDLAQMNQGLVRIGSGMTACMFLLPPVIEKFQARYPKVEIQVQTGTAQMLLPKIRDGSLDVGVLTLPVNSPDLETVPFAREQMVLVASPKNRKLAGRRVIRPDELPKLKMILFHPETATRKLINEYFIRLGITPRVTMDSENVATIKPLVRVNLGVSILPLPAVAAEVKRRELVCLRLAGENLAREIGLVFHKSSYHPKPLLELIELFRQTKY